MLSPKLNEDHDFWMKTCKQKSSQYCMSMFTLWWESNPIKLAFVTLIGDLKHCWE